MTNLSTRVAFLLVSTLVLACSSPRPPIAPDPARPELVVMSYNVNFGIEGDPPTVDVIRRTDADLVVLQETTPGWERHLRAELSTQYPHMQFQHSSDKPAGGLAVLGKAALGDKGLTPSPVGWFPGWLVVASTPIGPVQVLNVHLRPPLSDPGRFASGYFSTKSDRRAEIEVFFEGVDPALPTLVAGDFNEDEDGRAVGFLAGRGMVSVLPEYAPDQRTWRWMTSVGEIESRLDHVVYDPRMLEPLDARVFEEGSSDHLPIVARFARVRASSPRTR